MIYGFLSPNSTDDEKKEFGLLLNRFYKKFGIERNKATRYKAKDYPIFSDFLKFIESELYIDVEKKIVNNTILPSRITRLDSIKLTIEDLVENFGDLFNGHSNIEDVTKENLISYNFKNISQYDERIFISQLFSVLTSVWGQALVQGRREKEKYDSGEVGIEDVKKFLILIDEAHVCINPRKIEAVRYINRMLREDRKYFAGVGFANHSINDYVPENVSDAELSEIKKIFSLCQYKFLMKQGIENKENIKKIFASTISDKQIDNVVDFQKGDAIMFIDGMPNIKMKFELSKEEIRLFKGGA
ncbi:MAG: hypothetical protein E6094_00530 [Clostridium perfringens]|nr:hypothetical protein [Clostridium perfringens]